MFPGEILIWVQTQYCLCHVYSDETGLFVRIYTAYVKVK